MLIENDEKAQNKYDLLTAKAGVEKETKELQRKRQRKRQLTGGIIVLVILAAIFLISLLTPGSSMHNLFFPRTADPFTGVSVTFSGMSGDGRAELLFSDRSAAEYTETARYEVTPESGLSNGDTVTVKAKAPSGWRFEPAEKQFTVESLTMWVLDTEQLSGDNLTAVHENSERLIREDWADIVSSSLARDITYTPDIPVRSRRRKYIRTQRTLRHLRSKSHARRRIGFHRI